jgi:thiamine transport system permease protein
MAYGPVALATALVATTLVPVLVVLGHGDSGGLAPGDWAAVRFTLWQAALSAVLSVILAIPVGRALFRRRFPGRDGLVVLMGAPFLMPTLVAAMGVIAVFGAGGPLAWLAATMGLPPPDPFGAHGVVLAHVFLNLPLAVRMILHGWHDIPADRMRLAASLGFRPRDILRHLELPMLRAIVPGALAMIFALCLTSFAVALTLGGGPGATTVELGIYQALRFEFDLPRAAQLALVQLGLGAVAAMVAALFWRPALMGTGTGRAFRPIAGDQRGIFIDGMVLAAATAFVAGPLVAVALHGAAGLGELPAAVWPALGRSLVISLPVAIVTTVLALVLALAAARGGAAGRLAELAAVLPLALSALVLGTGLFLILRPVFPPSAAALPVTLGVNVLLALPFAFRLLLPSAKIALASYGRLTEAFGLRGWALWRLVWLPVMARPLGFSAGVAGALAMGDLGVIALFAAEGQATLPLVIQRLMGSYRMDAAAAASLVLVAAAFAVFWVFDRGGARAAA